MILNHLNLTVTDVPAARRFLETYFGLQAHTNPFTGEPTGAGDHPGFAVLVDDRGMVLTLMKGRTADGFAAGPPERSHAYTFYVKAPGGFVVEVLC